MESDIPEILVEELHAVRRLLRFVEKGLARLARMDPPLGKDPTRAWLETWQESVASTRALTLALWARGEISAHEAARRIREARTLTR